MRERSEIEREIDDRREDLVENLGELREVVQDKVQDVKDRLNVPKRAKAAASRAGARVKEAAGDVGATARERPAVVAAAAGGLLLAGVLVVRARRARRRRREAGLEA